MPNKTSNLKARKQPFYKIHNRGRNSMQNWRLFVKQQHVGTSRLAMVPFLSVLGRLYSKNNEVDCSEKNTVAGLVGLKSAHRMLG